MGKGNFRRKMTTIVGNRGQLRTSTLSPHLLSPHLDFPETIQFSMRASPRLLGNVSETPTPTTWLKSMAVHLQFVRQYAPHLYRHTFLASKLRRKGNPAVRLLFVLQYASHLYGSTPPICTAVLLEKYWGLGSPERF